MKKVSEKCVFFVAISRDLMNNNNRKKQHAAETGTKGHTMNNELFTADFDEMPCPEIYNAIRQIMKRHPYGVLTTQIILELVGMGHDVFTRRDIRNTMGMLGAKPLGGMDAGWKL